MIPKYIQDIIIQNIEIVPAPFEYRLVVNKHIPGNSINNKLEKLTKWANSLFPNSIEIKEYERIIGSNRVIDLIIYDPASKEIDKLKGIA